MNEILTELQHLLDNDAIVRPSPANISLKDLGDQHSLIEKLSDDFNEATSLIETYLQKNNHSVLALYILTILQVKNGLDFKLSCARLVQLFSEVQKTSHVVFLAREILKYVESLYALNILISHIDNHSLEEQLEIYERVLKQDITNYNLCIKIAKLKQKFDLPQEAYRYYKMAFYRALEAKNQKDIVSIWENLISLDPGDLNFFLDNGRKIVKFFSKENSQLIFQKLFNHYFHSRVEHLDACLTLLKELIRLNENNHEYRQKVITLYKEKYHGHSKFQEIILFTNINKPWKKLTDQIELFEKLIQFDIGTYVYHNSFGYGVIRKINMPVIKKPEQVDATQLFIDFKSKKNHRMTLRIALNSLNICSSDNLHALKLFNEDKLKIIKEGNVKNLLTSIFNTSAKPISSNDIKALLVPMLYEQKDWLEQWRKMKQSINQSDEFELKNKLYGFKTLDRSYKEELLKNFSGSNSVLSKLKIADIFLLNFGVSDNEANVILDNLLNLLKEKEKKSGEEKQKILILTYLNYFQHQHHQQFQIDFTKALAEADGGAICSLFDELPSNALKQSLIDLTLLCFSTKTSDYSSDTTHIALDLFFTPNTQAKAYILDQLQKKNAFHLLDKIIVTAFNQEQKNPKHFLIVVKHVLHHNRDKLSYNKIKLFDNLVDLLDKSYKDMNFSKGNVEAKWLFQQVHSLLFDDSTFFNFLRTSAESDADKEHKFSIIEKLNKMLFLENYLKIEIKEIMTK